MCFDTQGPFYVLLPPKRHMCSVDTLRYVSACPQKPVDLALEVAKGTITKSSKDADLSKKPVGCLATKVGVWDWEWTTRACHILPAVDWGAGGRSRKEAIGERGGMGCHPSLRVPALFPLDCFVSSHCF